MIQTDQSSQVPCSTMSTEPLRPPRVIAFIPYSVSAAAASKGGEGQKSDPSVRSAVAFPPTAALSASQMCCVSSVFLLGPLGTTVNSDH